MSDADHERELAELRPLVSQLRHDLAVERRHAMLLAEELRQAKRELEIRNQQERNRATDEFEPHDPGTRRYEHG